MRLEHSVVKAYPKEPKRQSRALKDKIRKTAPSWFNELLDRKRDIKQLLKIGKSISWADIVELAVEQDKKLKKSSFNQSQSRERILSPTVDFGNLSHGSPAQVEPGCFPQLVNRAAHQCTYCLKRGHGDDKCRKRLGQCLLCGSSEHWIRECCRYQADHGRGDVNNRVLNVHAPIFQSRLYN